MTINILSNKGDEEDGDADDPSEQTTQNISSSSQSFLEIPNKGKEKDIGQGRKDCQTNKKIPSNSERGGDDSSSSDDEPDRRNT